MLTASYPETRLSITTGVSGNWGPEQAEPVPLQASRWPLLHQAQHLPQWLAARDVFSGVASLLHTTATAKIALGCLLDCYVRWRSICEIPVKDSCSLKFQFENVTIDM